jgi:hypothetical protein
LLAQGRLFSPGTPASSTTKTGRHAIAEILLKVTLNTKIQIQNSNSIVHKVIELKDRTTHTQSKLKSEVALEV